MFMCVRVCVRVFMRCEYGVHEMTKNNFNLELWNRITKQYFRWREAKQARKNIKILEGKKGREGNMQKYLTAAEKYKKYAILLKSTSVHQQIENCAYG